MRLPKENMQNEKRGKNINSGGTNTERQEEDNKPDKEDQKELKG